MKIIVCDTPSGQYAIPLKLVAEHRAKYYSKVDEFSFYDKYTKYSIGDEIGSVTDTTKMKRKY